MTATQIARVYVSTYSARARLSHRAPGSTTDHAALFGESRAACNVEVVAVRASPTPFNPDGTYSCKNCLRVLAQFASPADLRASRAALRKATRP